MRKRTLIVISLVSVALPFFSCSRETLPVVLEEDGERTLPMVFAGGVTAFDDVTKAPAEFSFSNENVVYLRLTDPRDVSHPLIGRATYDKTQSPARWQFTYQGSYDNLSSGKVEAYLFEKNHSKERSVLNISYKTPVYGTENGIFNIVNDTLNLYASLKPLTGRVTFVNEESQGVYVSQLNGLSYYTGFDIDSFEFNISSAWIYYQNWMTPGDGEEYFYGFVTNEGNPILMYVDDYYSSNRYICMVSKDFLKKGYSGYCLLPTDSKYSGWLKCRNETFTFYTYNYPIEFRFIGAGTYLMGGDDTLPAHEVTITQPLYMMTEEVTRDLWAYAFDNGGDSEIAVTGKTYEEILVFCEMLNQKWENYTFRLPTEAEWELATKGGFKNYSDYIYSGGNVAEQYANLANSYDEENPFTYWIKQRSHNSRYIYDMSGNAAELCSDWYDESYTYHVVRGGSAFDYDKIERLTVTHRCSEADYPLDQIGFRLVLEVNPFTFD